MRWLVLGACGWMMFVACDTPPATVAKKRTKPAAKLETRIIKAHKPVKKPVPVFVYSSVGKRDPFRSYLADIKDREAKIGALSKRSATETFELDQYRLTGLIFGTSQPKAMVEDPKGVGHTLKIGTRLGRNGGRVRRISSKGIIVRQSYRNSIGELTKVDVAIDLPSKEFGNQQ